MNHPDAKKNGTSLSGKGMKGGLLQRTTLLSIAFLIASLLFTLFFWDLFLQNQELQIRATYAVKTDEISAQLVKRMHDNEQVLRGAAALFGVNKVVSRSDWHNYVSALQVGENYPGIQGIGFAKWLTPEEKDANIRKIRSEGFPEYVIRPEGERPVYTSIIYLEPFDWRNQRAFGYDMYSEPLRRAAMDKARDENITTIAAKITLVQETDKDKQSGMLMYLPVYQQGMPLTTVALRRKAFVGFAYSPIRMNDFVQASTSMASKGIAFDISVSGNPAEDNLMYSRIQAEKIALPEHYKPTITTEKSVQAFGPVWKISTMALPGFNKENRQGHSSLVLIAGIIFSLLGSSVVFLMLKNRNMTIEQSEEKVGILNSRLALAVDSAGIGVWDYHVPENLLIWDKWMYALYGVQEEDFSGAYDAWQRGLHPEDRARGDEEFSQALRGEKEFDTEFKVVWPSGDVRYLKANALVLRDHAGKPLRIIGVNYDITAIKMAEKQLQEEAKKMEREAVLLHRVQERLTTNKIQLEEMNNSLQQRVDEAIAELRRKDQIMISQGRQAAMGEMVANIAHQWRQPLNALAMVLGNIKSAHQYGELSTEYIDKSFDNGNRLIQKMSATINDFRNFFNPDKATVDFAVREQIMHAVSLVDAALTNENIAIHLDTPYELILNGLPNEFSQVLLNLLTNAQDAIKESGAASGNITIRIFERNGLGCISIRDDGGGIPADIIDRIFEPYFSTKSLGTGIGLYMSKMIVERSMGGAIEARNVEGGAEFVIVTRVEGTPS